ncbi:MFS transporter [Vallicoccus soli]|uniref:MFS transporter n=1 Tax=Vallicoccus soli TaxID=2339232 RepID=UPI001C49ADCA|nr:MFS transporter [Vallicoccus soli]
MEDGAAHEGTTAGGPRADEGARRPGAHRAPGGGAQAAGRALRTAGRHGARAAGATARGARAGARRVRRATHAQGAGATGLGRLIELQGLNHAGDALVTVALAGTLFFSVPVGEARGSVALYLLVTMAPFALLAPVVGPLLDRVRSGRRWALAGTFALRAVLALVMASAVSGTQDPLRLYPAAFGVLVLSRAYGVTRATVMPRLLPPGIGLVSANGRAQLAGTAALSVAGGLGAGVAALLGPGAVLWACAAVMALGAVQSLRLPPTVDSDEGEVGARWSARPEPDGRRGWNVGRSVIRGVRANAALRAFSGFLTLWVAFLVREEPLDGLPATLALGLVVVGAAAGAGLGTSLGTLLRERRPEVVVVVVVGVAAAASLLGAWTYERDRSGALVLALVACAAGAAQSMGKLSLDAIVQREVPEEVRTSAFARTETVLQLAWVLGGGLGILVPLGGGQGLLLAAVLLGAGLVLVLRERPLRGRSPGTAG